MIVEFETETGSIYRVNTLEKTWERLQKARQVGAQPLRTESGTYYEMSTIVGGQSVTLVCPPLNSSSGFRYITTSLIVRIALEPAMPWDQRSFWKKAWDWLSWLIN